MSGFRSDFDWGCDNDSVVLRAYGSIAVHENPYGDVVVRQERDAMEEDDHYVAIPIQDAEHIANAIIRKAKEIKREANEQPAAEAPERRAVQHQLDRQQPTLGLVHPPNDKPPTVPKNQNLGTATATKAGAA